MHMQVYLKTTETCNLNCSHCYTSGRNGRKIYFDPNKTLSFFYRMKRDLPQVKSIKIIYHGGEPMLAPIKDMWDIYHNTKNLWDHVDFSITTNLVYDLSDERLEFLRTIGSNGMGSSFDDMRFRKGDRSYGVWSRNSQTINAYLDTTMMVSLSSTLIQDYRPKDIYDIAEEHGYKYLLIERITPDGNAGIQNPAPSNEDQDQWLYELFRYRLENDRRVGDMLLSELATAYLGEHTANRCRNCEQSMITINADGTIAGCPNTAPRDYWGSIDQDVRALWSSPNRLKAIQCETHRDPRCYNCEAFDICNGDCHQLKWDGDYCAAPKKVWKHMIRYGETDAYRRLVL